MRSFIFAIMPMLLLFMIPILIPIVAVAVGAVADAIRTPRPSPAEVAVIAAQARSAPWRAEMKKVIAAAEASASKPPDTDDEQVAPMNDHPAIRPDRAGQRSGGRIAA